MSIRAVAYIKGLTVCPNGEHVSRSEKLVGLILGDSHQDRAHRRTYPSVDGMAEDAGFSERQFIRLLASLERKGVIRREYPDGHGRGKTTFYFFPELDDKAGVKQPAAVLEETGKGCQNVTLSDVNEPVEKVTFSGQKGDRRVTSGAPVYINKNNRSNKDKDTPVVPTGGDVEGFSLHPLLLNDAADEVMRCCGWTDRRLRSSVCAQLRLVSQAGEALALIAARMISNWDKQSELNAEGLLRVAYGPRKFIDLGRWNDLDSWHWDHQAIEIKRNARVGTR